MALGKGRRLRDGRTTLYNDGAFRGGEAGADRGENNERSKMQGDKTGRVGARDVPRRPVGPRRTRDEKKGCSA
jgi:hypothetical protein